MKLARTSPLIALLAACSSGAPLVDGGDSHHADAAGVDHPTDVAGSGAAGSGAAGSDVAGSGAAGTPSDARADVPGGPPDGPGGAPDGGHEGGGAGADAQANDLSVGPGGNQDVDLLFMIDNSASMTPLQRNLISAFPTFIGALKAFPGGLPNLHVAIVSSSLGAGRTTDIDQCPPGGDRGIFRTAALGATCARATLNAGQTFLIATGAGQANFTGDLSDMFSCIAALGDRGCGFEHQLASVLRALGADGTAAPVENAGFLRPSAFLHVILLTNEDDCSAPPDSDLFDTTSMLVSDPLGPLQSYRCNEFGHLCGGQPPPRTPASAMDLSGTCVSAEDGRLLRVADAVTSLKSLKSNSKRLLVSTIAGPTSPYVVNVVPAPLNTDPSPWPLVEHSCMTADGTFADPSVRLQQWTNAFGPSGLFEPICGDLAPTMQLAAAQLEAAISAGP